jgi:hypothetical protein
MKKGNDSEQASHWKFAVLVIARHSSGGTWEAIKFNITCNTVNI